MGLEKKTVFQSIQSMQGMMPTVAMVTADSKSMPGDFEKLAVFKIKVFLTCIALNHKNDQICFITTVNCSHLMHICKNALRCVIKTTFLENRFVKRVFALISDDNAAGRRSCR